MYLVAMKAIEGRTLKACAKICELASQACSTKRSQDESKVLSAMVQRLHTLVVVTSDPYRTGSIVAIPAEAAAFRSHHSVESECRFYSRLTPVASMTRR